MTTPPFDPHPYQGASGWPQQPPNDPYRHDGFPPSKAMAGWALGLSLVPCVSLVGLVLGIVVLVRSRDGRDHGKGLAIAALVASGLWVLVAACGVALGVAAEDPAPSGPRTISIEDLALGDCFDLPALDPASREFVELDQVTKRTCSNPHQWEFFARQQLAGSAYPGQSEAAAEMEAFCIDEFGHFVGRNYNRSELALQYTIPHARGWALGDHWGTCLVGEITGRSVTGSLRLSRR